jgi:hypothetical protein
MKYSEEQLIQIAHNNPQELIKIINSSHNSIKVLTDALEILGGEVDDDSIVLPVLQKLLRNINVSIRESALIGISSFYGAKTKPLSSEVSEKLLDLSTNDPSALLRDFAKDLLLKHK